MEVPKGAEGTRKVPIKYLGKDKREEEGENVIFAFQNAIDERPSTKGFLLWALTRLKILREHYKGMKEQLADLEGYAIRDRRGSFRHRDC